MNPEKGLDWGAGFGRGRIYRPPRTPRTDAGVENYPIAGLEDTTTGEGEPLRLYLDGFDGIPPHRAGQTLRPQRNGKH
ncbi:MAG: hypothetical protein AAB478_00480 [Patescibacteria group bacterium]